MHKKTPCATPKLSTALDDYYNPFAAAPVSDNSCVEFFGKIEYDTVVIFKKLVMKCIICPKLLAGITYDWESLKNTGEICATLNHSWENSKGKKGSASKSCADCRVSGENLTIVCHKRIYCLVSPTTTDVTFGVKSIFDFSSHSLPTLYLSL